MSPYSSTFAWKIPWTEEPGRLQSMGSLESDTTERLHFHFSLSCIGKGNGNPLQCSCLENPRDGEAWLAAVYGVAQSRTRLRQLSSSSRLCESESPNRMYWELGALLAIKVKSLYPIHHFLWNSMATDSLPFFLPFSLLSLYPFPLSFSPSLSSSSSFFPSFTSYRLPPLCLSLFDEEMVGSELSGWRYKIYVWFNQC